MGNPSDILRRKAEAAREDRDARIMSARRALRRALTRAAELGLHLPLSVRGVEEQVLDRDTLLTRLEPGRLYVSLDREGAPPGLITLDFQLLSALIEVQTLGQVFDKIAKDRKLTRTDAAVAMPLIDGTLNGFDQLIQGQEGAQPLAGYHFGTWQKDLRMVQASLPDGNYTLFRLSVILGHGERSGEMSLALPVTPEPVAPPEEPDARRPSLRDEVLDAPARLETVLHRQEMNLDQIAALKPGDVLTLPLRCLSEVRLHTGDRQTVASGVLGQIGGNRAVRLTGFGQPRVVAAPVSLDSLPNLKAVDLADAGLVEQPRARKPQAAPAVPQHQAEAQPQAAPAQPGPPASPHAGLPAASLSASVRDDPTGTEALLSELGLSDLGQSPSAGLSLGPLGDEDRAAGSFMADLPESPG